MADAQTPRTAAASPSTRAVPLLIVIAFLALLLVAAGSIFFNLRSQDFNALVVHTQQVRQINDDVMRLALDSESNQRGYLLTEQPAYFDRYQAAARALPGRLDELERLVSDNPQQVTRIRLMRVAVAARLASLARNADAARRGDGIAALWDIRLGRGRIQMQAVRSLALAIDTAEARLLEVRQREARRSDRLTLVASGLGAALVIVSAIGVAVILRRYVRALKASGAELDALNRGLEAAVAERTEQLTRANDEIQRFAYIVSHDLRAPLVNVMGYTSELEAAGRTLARQVEAVRSEAPALLDREAVTAIDEDIPEAIGFIRTSTVKMDRLINAILKLSREGRRALAPERLDMTAILQAIAGSLNHQVVEAGAEIRVEPLPELVSDRMAVEQIFGNLVDNAVKFFDRSRPGRVTISGSTEGAWATYRVSDNGRGIAAKDRERVFELFRRAGAQDRPGEGLGLAFVRNSVRRLGGSIELESEPGTGSTFTLIFPKAGPADTGADE